MLGHVVVVVILDTWTRSYHVNNLGQNKNIEIRIPDSKNPKINPPKQTSNVSMQDCFTHNHTNLLMKGN